MGPVTWLSLGVLGGTVAGATALGDLPGIGLVWLLLVLVWAVFAGGGTRPGWCGWAPWRSDCWRASSRWGGGEEVPSCGAR